MFHNLIESGSHRRDLARRGRFLLGTLALYSALIATAGVASVFAFNARLDAQNYEITMLPSVVPTTTQEIKHDNQPARTSHASSESVTVRKDLVLPLDMTPRTPPPISNEATDVKPIPHDGVFKLGKFDRDAIATDVTGPDHPGIVGGNPVANARQPVIVATVDPPPPPVRPTPAPTPPPVLRISQILNSKAVSKPVPNYPAIAIAARQEGTVTVEILIDEQGRVVSATAKEGPPMLREAARQAALLARFTPTKLNDSPVKVSGVISYNFTLR